MAKDYRMIRVPEELHARLDRLAKEILTAKELGQGYDDVPLAEQGERGIWVGCNLRCAPSLDSAHYPE